MGHPVAGVDVKGAGLFVHFKGGLMNVAANDAVIASVLRVHRDAIVEVGEVLNEALDPLLRLAAEVARLHAQSFADAVHEDIESAHPLVQPRAQIGEPFQRRHAPVEVIAVNHPELQTLARLVFELVVDGDIAKVHPVHAPKLAVVVTGGQEDLGAVFGFTQDRAHDVGVLLPPFALLATDPHVHDVAHEIEVLAFDLVKKRLNRFRIAAHRPQMEVRDEYSAVLNLVGQHGERKRGPSVPAPQSPLPAVGPTTPPLRPPIPDPRSPTPDPRPPNPKFPAANSVVQAQNSLILLANSEIPLPIPEPRSPIPEFPALNFVILAANSVVQEQNSLKFPPKHSRPSPN